MGLRQFAGELLATQKDGQDLKAMRWEDVPGNTKISSSCLESMACQSRVSLGPGAAGGGSKD